VVDDSFRDALERLIDEANRGISHEDFVSGVNAGTMGFKCMYGEPRQFIRGAQLVLFNVYVVLYMVAPLVVTPLWAWHENNWWLLGGIIASGIGTVMAGALHRQKARQTSIAALLIFAFIGGWIFSGLHNYWTFYFGAVSWGMVLFMIAEEAQWDYALQSLLQNQGIFDAAVATKRIMIVRAGDQDESTPVNGDNSLAQDPLELPPAQSIQTDSFDLTCTSCGTSIRIGAETAGYTIKCKRCGSKMVPSR
jgi:hypothetical protein